jgi:transposase-like protein
MEKPRTLQQAIRYFSDEQACIDTVAALRWPDGPVCPKCGHNEHYYLATQRRWKCKQCKKQFSVKVGTIFEDSPIGLDKWLIALWMLVNCKNGISSYEVARDLGITQKSAWFVMHRLRLALHNKSMDKLAGEVEVDETYIGGKARNMHMAAKKRRITGSGAKDKTAVLGFLERGGKVRTVIVPNTRRFALQTEVCKNVQAGSALYSDELQSYRGLDAEYAHKVINHAATYVDGKIHTNGLENFWSLLKRGINGTYVSVEPFHLYRYLDEQSFRYNQRATEDNPATDGDRFQLALSQIAGKRVTYSELTGKSGSWAN